MNLVYILFISYIYSSIGEIPKASQVLGPRVAELIYSFIRTFICPVLAEAHS